MKKYKIKLSDGTELVRNKMLDVVALASDITNIDNLIHDEETAIQAYDNAISQTNSDDCRKVFQHIRDEEKEHLSELKTLREQLISGEMTDSKPWKVGDKVRYNEADYNVVGFEDGKWTLQPVDGNEANITVIDTVKDDNLSVVAKEIDRLADLDYATYDIYKAIRKNYPNLTASEMKEALSRSKRSSLRGAMLHWLEELGFKDAKEDKYEIKNVRGHYDVYKNGFFFSSEDSYAEAVQAVKEDGGNI